MLDLVGTTTRGQFVRIIAGDEASDRFASASVSGLSGLAHR